MHSESPRGPEPKREMERGEIEARVRAAIEANARALQSTGEGVSDGVYWGALREQGQASKLRVRRLDDKPDEEPEGIYLLEEDGGYIEATYFAPDGGVGETIFVEFDRIVSIE